MKSIAKKIGIVLLCIGILTLTVIAGTFIGQKIYQIRYFKSLPNYSLTSYDKDPDCAICSAFQNNAPLLVNIHTGSARPMNIYPNHFHYTNQIREEESYGIFFMIAGDGWNGGSDPDYNYSSISIQRKAMYKPNLDAAALYFCEDCLQEIQNINPTSNFIIVDAYDKDNLSFYDLQDIESKEGVEIRHYTFALENKDTYLYSFKIQSSYYDGGKQLDYLYIDEDDPYSN